MSQVLGGAAALCVLLVAVEAVAGLCRENPMTGFVRGLVVAVLLLSGAASLLSADWDLDLPRAQVRDRGEELSGYVQSQAELAAREELSAYLEGLLAAAGLQAEKIQVETDIGEDSSIVCTKVSAWFAYASDGERARALLGNVLGDEIEIEVIADGA